MAKNSTPKSFSGPARVRLVVLDAEIPDGDMASFNQVLQNALRGPGTTVVARINGSPAKTLTHQPAAEIVDEAEETVDEVVADEVDDDVQIQRQPREPRKKSMGRVPKVVPLDMNAATSLADYAAGKDSGSQHKKYLISAAWLKECREIDAVNSDHIYTCFKSMGWPTNIPDFSTPLRDLKSKLQYFGKSDKGYEINHIGLDYVKKLGNGAK